ncbi:uncharacterized protein YecE (DUF72 family) [Paenibacillus shirakamiensis]|uniref:Uncharacterized protein YecE (DUF72 family) n=1 Tax=Paenibacillus shirakamiensis TaxID=1265935 RepID=A0ABS4JJF7_9BACL|nr:DUF72 domain-containing protein [Paenibacillus shirakamiensis]MBP2001830.1 uncharacterized protein YecE (DUF72 family) [Paenibacillus shirakamiensis]
MIRIGLTGWGDHAELYGKGVSAKDKLRVYSRHFPIVEIDSSFYAVQSQHNYQRWVEQTPEHFSFLIKAYQGMTGHSRGKPQPYAGPGEMFDAFLHSIEPVLQADKLNAILFQFPPWFDCTVDNVRQLKAIRKWMGDLPLAIEFRNPSWFEPSTRQRTLEFMKDEGWFHVVCDEPQIGQGSVPIVAEPGAPGKTFIRLHGRNAEGWKMSSAPNWREIRTLYRYSTSELSEWREYVEELVAKGAGDIFMIFNNNSGGDAADNAKEMMSLLGMTPVASAPKQLDLFGE